MGGQPESLGWFTDWNQGTFTTAASFDAAFDTVAAGFRAVLPGAVIMYNPNDGDSNSGQTISWQAEDPGTENVIGVDAYDFSGYQPNIEAVVSYAASKGIPWALPEWGLNGTDDPSYINTVYADVTNSNCSVEAYFDYAGSINSWLPDFPQSLAAFKADFSGSGADRLSPASTSTTAAPTTTTTAVKSTDDDNGGEVDHDHDEAAVPDHDHDEAAHCHHGDDEAAHRHHGDDRHAGGADERHGDGEWHHGDHLRRTCRALWVTTCSVTARICVAGLAQPRGDVVPGHQRGAGQHTYDVAAYNSSGVGVASTVVTVSVAGGTVAGPTTPTPTTPSRRRPRPPARRRGTCGITTDRSPSTEPSAAAGTIPAVAGRSVGARRGLPRYDPAPVELGCRG